MGGATFSDFIQRSKKSNRLSMCSKRHHGEKKAGRKNKGI